MPYSVLWLDYDHAKIFTFAPEGEKVTHYSNTHHHEHHTGHWEQERNEQQKKFFSEIKNLLSKSNKTLILGPSFAKVDFKNYLKNHRAENLLQSIIGMETAEKLTDGEIRDFAKNYFRKYNVFHS